MASGATALETVTDVTAVLENSPLTNAGYGSNLTWDGHVECDASVMDGCTLHYGAVGAVPGVKNPVKLAHHICKKQSCNALALGRVPPRLVSACLQYIPVHIWKDYDPDWSLEPFLVYYIHWTPAVMYSTIAQS